jgi:hypothetical protein
MKTKFTLLIWLFLGMSCIGGMCSKDGNGSNDNSDDPSYTEPVLKPEATWAYLTSDDMLYSDNNRPTSRKWIATLNKPAIVVPLSPVIQH